MAIYMERELACSRHTANEHLRVAHELVDLPMIAAEFRNGELPFTVVRELTRPATEATEGAWLDAIRGMSAGQVQQLVKGRKKGDLPSARPDPKLIKEKIFVEVSAETYAMWRQARIALDDEAGERLSDDALIQTMCKRACEPVPAGTDTGGVPRPGFQICVSTCKECKRGFHVGPGMEVEVAPERVEVAACDAVNLGDLESDDVPRVQSEIPAGTRVKVFARDGFACVVPGCTSRRHLACHHVVWRSKGGGHQAWNFVPAVLGLSRPGPRGHADDRRASAELEVRQTRRRVRRGWRPVRQRSGG
jgi:hypothetical protein